MTHTRAEQGLLYIREQYKMLTTEQKLDLLLERGITKTRFFTLPVAITLATGAEIGTGKCKAVILRLNKYTRNTTTGAVQAVETAYYGDAKSQEFELLSGIDSEIIFCEDLSEVFIRTAEACTVQVLVYL